MNLISTSNVESEKGKNRIKFNKYLNMNCQKKREVKFLFLINKNKHYYTILTQSTCTPTIITFLLNTPDKY